MFREKSSEKEDQILSDFVAEPRPGFIQNTQLPAGLVTLDENDWQIRISEKV